MLLIALFTELLGGISIGGNTSPQIQLPSRKAVTHFGMLVDAPSET